MPFDKSQLHEYFKGGEDNKVWLINHLAKEMFGAYCRHRTMFMRGKTSYSFDSVWETTLTEDERNAWRAAAEKGYEIITDGLKEVLLKIFQDQDKIKEQ